MTDAENDTARYDVTRRLRALLESITEFVDYIPDGEQQELLRILEEWKHPERRENLRKGCATPVDFVVEDQTFAGSIQNISTTGMYIESDETFHVGQEVTLSFSLPGLEKPVETGGEIIWTDQRGFGVNLEEPAEYLQEYLEG
ncbi:MAG: PilZ domain-containing protein [bacterium]|nr:PilZ domain-containing protein [bacterium]